MEERDNWQQWPGQTRGSGDGALVSRNPGDEVERRRAVGWHVTFRVGTRAVQSNLTSSITIPPSLLRRVCYDSETHANADPEDASSSPHLGCSPCMELFASLAPWPWDAVLSLLRLIAYTALCELASHRETAASPLPTPNSEPEHCQIHSGVPTFGCRADMSATLCLVTPHQFDLLRDAAASCHRMILCPTSQLMPNVLPGRDPLVLRRLGIESFGAFYFIFFSFFLFFLPRWTP